MLQEILERHVKFAFSERENSYNFDLSLSPVATVLSGAVLLGVILFAFVSAPLIFLATLITIVTLLGCCTDIQIVRSDKPFDLDGE